MISARWRGPGLAVALFFAFKIVLGAAILIASARWMAVVDFAVFSQLLILIAYLVSVGTAGVQNGLIRQIAAANGDPSTVAREARGAISIWVGVSIATLIGISLFRVPISRLLVGSAGVAYAIPWLALLAMLAGLGQLLCSVLTGCGRAGTALSVQAVGLIGGTAPALFLLHQGAPVAAALAFSAGQSTTAILAGLQIREILIDAWRNRDPLRPEVRRLLGFSVAFLATASIMPLTLIMLRSVYRTAFGLDALGYWLAANRISDVNSQLLGLYMVQAFLPAMVATPLQEQRRLTIRTVLGALCVMMLPLLVFLAEPSLVISTFLSAKFLPATMFFAGYLAGDALRVGQSTASFAALAHARLKLYVGLEAAVALLMSLLVIGLSWAGNPYAPAIAYPATYLVVLLAAGLFVLNKRRVSA